MQLSDTNDLVFYPAMMELKPAEEKKVRVGSAFRAAVTTERSYRIFFEELPPARVTAPETDTAARGAQVRVLTKMGVPIFVQPPNPVLKGDLADVTIGNRRLAFDVRNTGNSFFMVTGATVTGLSKSGATTFTTQHDGWYVLAGGTRHYEFEIPANACSATDRIRIAVASSLSDEKGTPNPLTQEVALNGAACK